MNFVFQQYQVIISPVAPNFSYDSSWHISEKLHKSIREKDRAVQWHNALFPTNSTWCDRDVNSSTVPGLGLTSCTSQEREYPPPLSSFKVHSHKSVRHPWCVRSVLQCQWKKVSLLGIRPRCSHMSSTVPCLDSQLQFRLRSMKFSIVATNIFKIFMDVRRVHIENSIRLLIVSLVLLPFCSGCLASSVSLYFTEKYPEAVFVWHTGFFYSSSLYVLYWIPNFPSVSLFFHTSCTHFLLFCVLFIKNYGNHHQVLVWKLCHLVNHWPCSMSSPLTCVNTHHSSNLDITDTELTHHGFGTDMCEKAFYLEFFCFGRPLVTYIWMDTSTYVCTWKGSWMGSAWCVVLSPLLHHWCSTLQMLYLTFTSLDVFLNQSFFFTYKE